MFCSAFFVISPIGRYFSIVKNVVSFRPLSIPIILSITHLLFRKSQIYFYERKLPLNYNSSLSDKYIYSTKTEYETVKIKQLIPSSNIYMNRSSVCMYYSNWPLAFKSSRQLPHHQGSKGKEFVCRENQYNLWVNWDPFVWWPRYQGLPDNAHSEASTELGDVCDLW